MKDPRTLAEALVRELQGALGARLRAAGVFGSAARGEWIRGLSDVNALVLLDDIDAPALRAAGPAARKAALASVRPLVMELDEWHRAADVFAIELADMKDASVPLLGDDPVTDVVIHPSVLRFQAERELRAKLLHLHAGMLVHAEDAARLGELFVRALPSFTTYLRAALRLAQQPVPAKSGETIEQGCRVAGTDPGPFLRVLEARQRGGALELSLADPLADQFNRAAEGLAAFTDAFGK